MSGLPLRIRSFKNEDLETLCEIDRICFADDVAFSRAELVSLINHPRSITRVGERLGRILGFAMARIENPACAHVLTLDVVPEARRRGIGRSLMIALHKALSEQGVRVAILEVSVRNLPAQRLYQTLCYRYSETLYGYYGGRENAYRMLRTVT
jgi:ribosomal-protein-alanine N-acetyltransferase